MTATLQQLNSFHRFAMEKLNSGSVDLSLEDLFGMWQIENATPEQRNRDVLAVKAAIRDLENGDRGIPFDQHIRELRDRYDPSTTNE